MVDRFHLMLFLKVKVSSAWVCSPLALTFSSLPSLPSNTSFFFSLLVACQRSWLGKTVAIADVYWTVKQNSTHVQLATIQWKAAIFTTFISDSRLKNMVRSNLFFSYSVAAVFLPGWYHDKVDIMHLFTLILITVQCVGAAIIKLIEIRYVLSKHMHP